MVNAQQNTVAVLLGSGSGTFAPSVATNHGANAVIFYVFDAAGNLFFSPALDGESAQRPTRECAWRVTEESTSPALWIAIKLLAPQAHDAEDTPEAIEDLWRAVRLVVVANIVMSLDNVIAVAAVAKGDYVLLTLGLVVSIPIVIAGSAIILALLERYPILIWGGAGVLGWVAGEIFATDQVVLNFFSGYEPEHVELVAQIFGALCALGCGFVWRTTHKPVVSEV